MTYRHVPMKRRFARRFQRGAVLRIFTAKDWHDWRRRAGKDDELDALVPVSAPSLRHARVHAPRGVDLSAAAVPGAARLVLQSRLARHVARRRRSGSRTGGTASSLGRCRPSRASARECGRSARSLPFAPRRLPPALAPSRSSYSRSPRTAARSGCFDYDAHSLANPSVRQGADDRPRSFEAGRGIAGRKRVTYGRGCNPWMADGEHVARRASRVSPRDTRPCSSSTLTYLSAQRVPLMRSAGAAGRAVAARRSRLARRLLPAAPAVRPRLELPQAGSSRSLGEPQRLPGQARGRAAARGHGVRRGDLPGWPHRTRAPHALSATDVDEAADPDDSGLQRERNHVRPSGLKPNAAGFFSRRPRGRDVWVLDMRTSCGMPTSRLPWTLRGRRARRHSRGNRSHLACDRTSGKRRQGIDHPSHTAWAR